MDLRNNDLIAVPSLTNLTALTSLVLIGNKLEFASIVPNRTVAGVLFNPQDSVGLYDERLYQIGQSYEISRQISGSANTYSWFRIAKTGGETAVTSGVSGSTLTLNIQNFSDEGYYYAKVTNTNVPGLTLNTQSIFVKVSSLERDNNNWSSNSALLPLLWSGLFGD
jgi:hypothetical protein